MWVKAGHRDGLDIKYNGNKKEGIWGRPLTGWSNVGKQSTKRTQTLYSVSAQPKMEEFGRDLLST